MKRIYVLGPNVTIGPSLTGHDDLHWLSLEDNKEILLIQGRDPKLAGKQSREARPCVVLRLKRFRTEKELYNAMVQAENDLLFGTPNVGTIIGAPLVGLPFS
jgi:hypothetical protein